MIDFIKTTGYGLFVLFIITTLIVATIWGIETLFGVGALKIIIVIACLITSGWTVGSILKGDE
jgi:hypothetical protein